ncbi:MAG: hypothetical protein ABIH37_00630 [archaeon]
MEDCKSIEFENFDRAVSLLSMNGYYAKDFIEDFDCKIERYDVYNRTSETASPIVYIYRKGLIEFADDSQFYSKERKNILRIFGKTKKLEKPKKSTRPKNSNFGKLEKPKKRNNVFM